MEPHQRHYRKAMRRLGWLSKSGKFVWPKDKTARRVRLRELFGLSVVSTLDYAVHRSEDEIFDTHNAPWANPERVDEDGQRRREVLRSLTAEQKAVVLEVVHNLGEEILTGISGEIDQFCGGKLEMSVKGADDANPDEVLQIQPGTLLDMHQECFVWLEEFSRIYGK
jgi:hypothetical protein